MLDGTHSWGENHPNSIVCSTSKQISVRRYENIRHGRFFFTFMGPCITNVLEQDQHDAKLRNIIYYYKCPTCFRRFLRPSSGAQNCIHSIWYLSSFFWFLPLWWVSWNLRSYMFQAVPPPIIRSSKLYTQHLVFVELFLLLTAMVSELELYSNKYRCVTLHLVGLAWIYTPRTSRSIPRKIFLFPDITGHPAFSFLQTSQTRYVDNSLKSITILLLFPIKPFHFSLYATELLWLFRWIIPVVLISILNRSVCTSSTAPRSRSSNDPFLYR